MSEFIPNSFQTPNLYVDQYLALMTPEEWKVMSYLNRRIFGFQKRRDRVSLSQLTGGIVDREGKRLDYGTGMSLPTVKKALRALKRFRLVVEVAPNDPEKNEGTLYELQLDSALVDLSAMQARAEELSRAANERMERARESIGQEESPSIALTPINDIDPHQQDCTPSTGLPTPPSIPLTPPPSTALTHPPVNGIDDTISRDIQLENQGNPDSGAAAPSAERGEIDLSFYPEDVREVILQVCGLWKLVPPGKTKGKGGEYALWIKESRYLIEACAEFGPALLVQVHEDWRREFQNGRPGYTVARPGSVIRATRAKAGLLRGGAERQHQPEESQDELDHRREEFRRMKRQQQEAAVGGVG